MYLTVLNSIKKADTIICISENTKNDLIAYYPSTDSKKIEVIPLWVSDDFFISSSEERIIPERYFFSLTTHPKRKNILRILDIISDHREDLGKHRYVIAGIFWNDSRAELQMRIETLGITDMVLLYWYATSEEVRNLYRNAEFCIYPSYYEGFWLPILEAMASWCPVISSDNSSLPEVNPNKECQFQATNNQDIYKSMRYILDMDSLKRTDLIRKNTQFARSMTWKNTAQKTVDIFNSL
jgi:glycosyltransferase involved in cell wall biosynthesis